MWTYLQVMRYGLPCRHTLVALATALKRPGEFRDVYVYPRGKVLGDPWEIGSIAGLSNFDGHERRLYAGSFTGNLEV